MVAGGIVAGDGSEYEADIIVLATGFRATEYLFPMEIVGRDGQRVEDLWSARGAMAYMGCMLPGIPNLFSLYGPNANGGLNVSQFHELTTLYALQCIERLLAQDKKAIEVDEESYRDYNALVDERNNNKAWSDPRAHNYYWTRFGRSATMCPVEGAAGLLLAVENRHGRVHGRRHGIGVPSRFLRTFSHRQQFAGIGIARRTEGEPTVEPFAGEA
jgi:4-hydroxyacetophenone monooxygenase